MEQQRRVAAVILAAGESRRYGSPKQLARLAGRTLLEHVVELARSAGLGPLVAVVPAWLARPAWPPGAELSWVPNPDPGRGLSHSLRLGLAALPDQAAAAVVLLGDQPRLPAGHLEALVAARGARPVVATRSGGALMAPLLLERSQFRLANEIRGDVGLRHVLAAHPQLVTGVEVREPIPDVDAAADLARLAAAETDDAAR